MEYKTDLVDSLRKLTKQEFDELEASCMEHGIIEAIKVWGEYLLDGRHRYLISKKRGLKFKTLEIDLPNYEAAKMWVLEHQAGRRNLTEPEYQRIRAEMAALTSNEEAAERFGVSERTIRRDVEAQGTLELMPDDIREKIESGEVMSSRRDIKKYEQLSDEERDAVNGKLRKDPSMTLHSALPEKTQNLAAQEFEIINTCEHLSPQAKRRLAVGEVHADSASVKKLAKMNGEKLQLLGTIIEDPEVTSLKQALTILNGTTAPQDAEERARKAVYSLLDQLERVESKIKDVAAVSGKSVETCMKRFQPLKEAAEALL